MSAVSNQFAVTEEIKTGRGIGPVTTAITLSQAIVGFIYILLATFGIVLPVEILIYSEIIVAAIVGYFTKGRAYVRDTKTVDGVNTPLPSQIPTTEVEVQVLPTSPSQTNTHGEGNLS